jgi:putative transposase
VVFKGAGFDFDAQSTETILRPGDLHFVTFSCYRRRPLLGTARSRDCFLKILDRVRSKWNFLLLGFVVMPEHVHLWLSEPSGSSPSIALQVLKQEVSRRLGKELRLASGSQAGLKFVEAQTGEEHFWQRRFYDFNVWSEKKFREKLEYMHANPIKRGSVVHPRDWPWSSWGHYALGETGLIRVDSLDDRVVENLSQNAGEKKSQNPHP